MLLMPSNLNARKTLAAGMILLTLITLGIAACAFLPHLALVVGRILSSLTVGKVNTYSGQQRLYLLQSAVKAVRATWGVGVGPGSFRSSSLLFAIVESTGFLGLAMFAGHLLNVLKIFRRETYALPGEPSVAIPVAVSWAACAGLIPAFITSPTAVPSYVFAILGGLALGWRVSTMRVPTGSASLSLQRIPLPQPNRVA